MHYYEIKSRGVLANSNAFAHHLDNFKTLFGLQERNSSVVVKPPDRATFRIHRQLDLKLTSANETKNEFFNIGSLDLPGNVIVNAFLTAKKNAFGAGYLVGQEAKKKLENSITGGGLAAVAVQAIEATRHVEKPLSPRHKNLAVVTTAFLFAFLTYLNDERNKEMVAIGLPPV